MTREQVIAQLVSRIKRDQGYLAYRKASGRKTRYDEQVTSDLRAIALAICWLEGETGPRSAAGVPPSLVFRPPRAGQAWIASTSMEALDPAGPSAKASST